PKITVRLLNESYNPRSNRFPSKRENTLWKNGSWFGNSTGAPTETTRTWGEKLLFFCTSWRRSGLREVCVSVESPSLASQTTASDGSTVREDAVPVSWILPVTSSD